MINDWDNAVLLPENTGQWKMTEYTQKSLVLVSTLSFDSCVVMAKYFSFFPIPTS